MKRLVYNRKSKWERLCRRWVRWKSESLGRNFTFVMEQHRSFSLFGSKLETWYLACMEDENGRQPFIWGGTTRREAARGFVQALSDGKNTSILFPVNNFTKTYAELVLEISTRGF